MELRALAEQVLFSSTIEEKIACPDQVTDECPGSSIETPSAPGRPGRLIFKSRSDGAVEFPGAEALEQDHGRGRLLHFFANHELLAAELMALALLKFPDAPPAFRKGLFQTLRDEQEHARLYIDRMKECGVEFGEQPVSGFFWRCVSGMEHPIDYVSSLCLTFEQANLDYCLQFSGMLSRVGDVDSSALLQKIYRDEIAHVAYGLKWFRRWKNPEQTDWEAFCRQLKFPLSPQRAKGRSLNVEGRRAAGFDSEFIENLSVFARSRGRTPNVFWFNPLEEGRISRGAGFTPGQHQSALVSDLENLPQFLCRTDDLVFVRKSPSKSFLEKIRGIGFPLPEFVVLESKRIPSSFIEAPRKLGRLRPWAWGPASLELLSPLLASVTGESRCPDDRFNERLSFLYSKSFGAELLRELLESTSVRGELGAGSGTWLCDPCEVGCTFRDLSALLDHVRGIRETGHHRVVVKETIGLAGGNAMRLWEPDLTEAQIRWMKGVLQGGGALVVEPWMERCIDFSLQLEMKETGLKLIAITGLVNDLRGQFSANWAGPGHHRKIPAQVASCFDSTPGVAGRILPLYEHLFRMLEPKLRDAGFLGPLGIDAFVFSRPDGTACFKPVSEVNPRYTMGRLLAELMNHVSPSSFASFELVGQNGLKRSGAASFPELVARVEADHPLVFEREPGSRIRHGLVCLNDAECAKTGVALLRVYRDSREFQENFNAFSTSRSPRVIDSCLPLVSTTT